MRPYSEYSNSSVKWIDQIPNYWSRKKLKYLFVQWTEQVGDCDLDGVKLVHYSIPNVQRYGTGRIEDGDNIQSNKIVLNGDEILVSKLNPHQKTICISNPEAYISVGSTEFVCLVKSSDEIELGFFYYLFLTTEFTEKLNSMVQSVTRSHQRIHPNHFLDTECWFPVLSKQKQIAGFLDRKTQQVDDLIKKAKQKIKLLKELRSSLINQCVTKGLDANVEMKESSVEWLGEIPYCWKLHKLARICVKIRNGYVGSTRNIMKEGGVKYIQGIHIKSGEIKYTPNGPYYVSYEWSNEHSETILEEEDVLVVQTGTIGEVGYVSKKFQNSNCHALIIVRINNRYGIGRYLLYLFLGDYVQNYLQSIRTGEVLYHINTKELRVLPVPLPSVLEQKQISCYLDCETSKIDRMVDNELKRINLLTEYRQSLLSNVVTGKIDVCDEVVL